MKICKSSVDWVATQHGKNWLVRRPNYPPAIWKVRRLQLKRAWRKMNYE